MKMTKEDREVITSLVVLGISIFLFVMTLQIPIKNETFLQSAKVFPLIISSVMLLLSVIYVINSLRKGGRIQFDKIKNSAVAFVKSPEVRRVALAVFFVAIYIFFGVAKGRFYICSAIFMLFILLVYVRRIKPWISIVAALAFTAACYLLFFKVFMVQLV